MLIPRRTLLHALALGWLPAGLQAQGARPEAVARSFYIEGEVTTASWAEPQPHLELVHSPKPLPASAVRARRLKPVADPLSLRAVMDRPLVVPSERNVWRVNLPSMADLARWDLPRPKIGQVIGVLGAAVEPVGGTPTISAQVIYLSNLGYPILFAPG